MLISSEIYYLNTALKGDYVYGIDSLRAKAQESVRNISPKDSLISKKYINEDGSITELGMVYIKRLEDYKNADFYIWIDGRVVAFKDTPYLITLECEENKDYKLERTLKAKIVARIFKDKPFLFGNREASNEKKIINPRKMAEILELKTEDEILFLRKENEGNIGFYTVYFKDDDNVFKYDVLKKTLFIVNPKEAREEILDLFKIKRGE